MDNNVERSLRLLDDTLTPPTEGLFKLPSSRSTKRVDLSLTVTSDEFQKLLDVTTVQQHSTLTTTILERTLATGDVIQSGQYPWECTLNNLYNEFALIMQNSINGSDILEIITDLGRCCTDALTVINGLKSKIAISELPDEKWLENERNNWRLLQILYQDRLQQQQQQQFDITEFDQYSGRSEKLCSDLLFKRDHLVRESQLVIDWLERNALDRDDPILHHSDWTYGWENTVHQIVSPDNIAICSNRRIVSSIYPDVVSVERLPLHHLDEENEKKLCQRIFTEIRCGKLQAAQELCFKCGHPWRAVLLQGWKLYHNPNDDDDSDNKEEIRMDGNNELIGYKDVEGNRRRDLWKSIAIASCKKKNMNVYETAALGALCGHLESILPVCQIWEDYLWAFMRTMIDIRVESEIRDSIVRNYRHLPDEYWEQKMSLNDIFTKLETSDNNRVRYESQQSEHIVQKLIILDEIPKLIVQINNWIEDSNTTTQSLRFYAHLVLFFDHIGQIIDRNCGEQIIEAYIERLSQMNETQLVAFYVSKLCKNKQITMYADHLEKILDSEQRQVALSYGEEYGLDVLAITKRIVECVRNRSIDIDQTINKTLTDDDQVRVSALDWLLFYEEQRAELLLQTNSMIFTFLTLNKLEAADLAIKKIPNDTIKYLTSNNNELNNEMNQTIKEYLSYRTYLDAYEAFNEWFKQHHNKPIEPNNLTDNKRFVEKVLYEHKLSQYNAELQRWKLITNQSAKRAKSLLYNVLLFPEGWLIGARNADRLRSICLPEIVLLLYSVLTESGDYEESVQLADIIASEKHGLYKVYSKEKLTEILEKICESSVILLKEKKDPFGTTLSA